MKIALWVIGIALFAVLGIKLGNAGYGPEMSGLFTLLCLLAIGLAIYFLPTILANARGHLHIMAIFCTNFFLGWTFIGWVAALVWACMNSVRSQPVQVVVIAQDSRWQNLRG